MIPNEKKKASISSLLQGITSKHHGDFYYLDCLCSFRKENKLKPHEKACENKDFCRIVIPSEKDNILEFNQYIKRPSPKILN